MILERKGFKPYYNWNTFNTYEMKTISLEEAKVLNLIITGIPSIPKNLIRFFENCGVLNLIITGIPSIQEK